MTKTKILVSEHYVTSISLIPVPDVYQAKKANFFEHIFSTLLTKFYEPKYSPQRMRCLVMMLNELDANFTQTRKLTLSAF